MHKTGENLDSMFAEALVVETQHRSLFASWTLTTVLSTPQGTRCAIISHDPLPTGEPERAPATSYHIQGLRVFRASVLLARLGDDTDLLSPYLTAHLVR